MYAPAGRREDGDVERRLGFMDFIVLGVERGGRGG